MVLCVIPRDRPYLSGGPSPLGPGQSALERLRESAAPNVSLEGEQRNQPDPRPRDDTAAVQDIVRDLAEIAHRISRFKGETYAFLSEDPKYEPLHLRLEAATGGGCMPSV
jgi:hypothetical protein